MPPLQLRQEFPTLKAFKEALHTWAIEAHFEPRILKSDTGRVRVGCKRDPNCDFVVRCNWERKQGREPLARVTVLRDRHTCVNGGSWAGPNMQQGNGMGLVGMGMNGHGMGGMQGNHHQNGLEIRQDDDGNIIGGARALGPIPTRGGPVADQSGTLVPVFPKVHRNSASRLPFLMEILPRIMTITKDTTPNEIRENLLREYGAEVHLQQCRRAKTEILKKVAEGGGGEQMVMESNNNNHNTQVPLPNSQQPPHSQSHQQDFQKQKHNSQNQSMETLGSDNNDPHQNMFGGLDGGLDATPDQPAHPFQMHAPNPVPTPQMQSRGATALSSMAGETPVKCPYCINHRWLKSIKDAVDHMSMHVVV